MTICPFCGQEAEEEQANVLGVNVFRLLTEPLPIVGFNAHYDCLSKVLPSSLQTAIARQFKPPQK